MNTENWLALSSSKNLLSVTHGEIVLAMFTTVLYCYAVVFLLFSDNVQYVHDVGRENIIAS